MFVSDGSLFIANDGGVVKIDLSSNSHVILVPIRYARVPRNMVKRHLETTVISFLQTWGPNRTEIIAGTGETGNSDGSRASFSQPVGIYLENNKTILVTDAQVGAI